MKSIRIIVQGFAFFMLFLCVNVSANAPFTKGNQLYEQGKFEEALNEYKTIIKSAYESEFLYFNMGNAYYRVQKYPMAILYYEKAKLMAPSNDDIQANLALAKTKIVDKIEILQDFFLLSLVKGFVMLAQYRTWFTLSIITFALSLIFAGFFLFGVQMKIRKISLTLLVLFFVVSMVSLVSGNSQLKRNTAHDFAIITTPTLSVKSAPDLNGTDLFVIHEGAKVKVISQSGNWREVKFENGNVGWIKESDFERI